MQSSPRVCYIAHPCQAESRSKVETSTSCSCCYSSLLWWWWLIFVFIIILWFIIRDLISSLIGWFIIFVNLLVDPVPPGIAIPGSVPVVALVPPPPPLHQAQHQHQQAHQYQELHN